MRSIFYFIQINTNTDTRNKEKWTMHKHISFSHGNLTIDCMYTVRLNIFCKQLISACDTLAVFSSSLRTDHHGPKTPGSSENSFCHRD